MDVSVMVGDFTSQSLRQTAKNRTTRRLRTPWLQTSWFWTLLGILTLFLGCTWYGHAVPIREQVIEVEEEITFSAEGGDQPTPPFNTSLAPIILIPGIGGAVMVEKESGLRVWLRFYEATWYFQRFMWGKFNASTNTMDPLPGQPLTVPLTSGYGLDGIRNLDPDVHWPIYDFLIVFPHPPLSYVLLLPCPAPPLARSTPPPLLPPCRYATRDRRWQVFDAVIKVLEKEGWVAGRSLFGFPYDFRQSVCWEPTMEALKELILVAEASTGRKATLVTHSMGGLVVRCLLARYPWLFEQAVGGWVSVGVPHQGAGAKILLEFLQGYNLGNLAVKPSDAKSLALEAPSVYELLPQERFKWSVAPYTALTLNGQRRVYAVGSGNETDYAIPLREACRTHSRLLPPDKTEDLEPFNEEIFQRSRRTRAELAGAELPTSVRFYSVVGVNESTPVGMEFGNVVRWGQLATDKYKERAVDGDGTVPTESATGHGFPVAGSTTVKAHHLALLQQKETLDLILVAARHADLGAAAAAP